MAQLQKKFIAANAVDQSKIRLANNSYLRARNAADSGDVNMLKVNASDVIEFSSVPQVSSDPSAGNDLVRKSYVDALMEGLKPKAPVRVATTGPGTLSSSFENGDSIDGVTLATGDRILIKDQSTSSENGIYIVAASGAPTRASDANTAAELTGAYTAVQFGTANAGKFFVESATISTLDTDPVTFVFFNSATSLTGGDGITISGSDISVDHDGQGLQFVTNQLALELDGSTLSKSASGLKVATSGITNNEVATGIDAAKLADGSVSNTEFQYINSLSSNAQTQINARLQNSDAEQITLTGTDITNQYIDLSFAAYASGSIALSVVGGLMQERGVDYTVSLTGGAGGVTRITFAGDLATGGGAELVSGDKLIVQYARL